MSPHVERKPRSRRGGVIALAGLALTLAIAGCGGDGDNESPDAFELAACIERGGEDLGLKVNRSSGVEELAAEAETFGITAGTKVAGVRIGGNVATVAIAESAAEAESLGKGYEAFAPRSGGGLPPAIDLHGPVVVAWTNEPLAGVDNEAIRPCLGEQGVEEVE